MGSEQQHRFPLQERSRKRWAACLPLSCFGSHKGKKRIVPSSRSPEGNASSAPQPNGGPQPIANQQHTHILAPPSSPASFSNSALPSTTHSPANCFMSASSPGGPTMFATGPYAHETQLVSPPVFSAFTTEPSTAPFTPPPELAHITTPSSPDVPYARFLAYQDPSFYPQNKNLSRTDSGNLFGNNEHTGAPTDSNFFCPATFAQFYQDTAVPAGGRLSVSNDSDVNPNQNRPNRIPKQDVEELEAYRASFGFSADDIITTTQYVEITDVMDHSFTMTPFTSDKSATKENTGTAPVSDAQEAQGLHHEALLSSKDYKSSKQPGSRPVDHIRADEDIFSKMGLSRTSRKYMSSSDAEVEYRRGRSLREGKGGFA
ncbi:hypothetical protein ACFE04_025727 [Oxalis oulophora]